jgi:hypothetical protein
LSFRGTNVGGEEKANTEKCKYVICLMYPKTETIEGTLDQETFKHQFMEDYLFLGWRQNPPESSVVDGILVASDGHNVVSLPIVHWTTEDKKTVYNCQGAEPGKAPFLSVREESREALIKKIKEQLKRKD